jgi:hypothetical protein
MAGGGHDAADRPRDGAGRTPGAPALECVDCGAVWQSKPAAQASAMHGGCLRCGGRLVSVAAPPEPGERLAD